MKIISFLSAVAAVIVLTSGVARGQTATVDANTSELARNGGTVQLSVVATYEGMPAALGWSLELPTGWTLESVSGPNVPPLSPEPGTAGSLEFAYTTVPPRACSFSVGVRYPAKALHATVHATLVVRADGHLTTVNAAPVVFSRVADTPRVPER